MRRNRSHDNGYDGLYLCWHVQHGVIEDNEYRSKRRDGISVGFRDLENVFIHNVTRDNARAGVYLREENEANAPNGNVLRENVIENNGRPDAPGYAVWIDGPIRYLTLHSNTIRETRAGERATQKAGIYIGLQADYITCSQNSLGGNLKRLLVNRSKGPHNDLH